jgi:signal peptidase II
MMAADPVQRRGMTVQLAAFALVALVVIAADRVSKLIAVDLLFRSGARSVPILTEYIRFTYVENRGAAFGVLQNQTAFFILVGVVVIGVIVASFRYMSNPGWLLILALGLQMGGAIGNLIDRVNTGYVVDFIDLTYWPVFNIADSAIVVGVALLAYLVAFKQSGSSPERRDE